MLDKVIYCVLTDEEPPSSTMAELITFLSICNHINVSASQSLVGISLNEMLRDLLWHLVRIPHSKYVPLAIGAVLQLIATLPGCYEVDCEFGAHLHQLWVLQGLAAVAQRSLPAFVTLPNFLSLTSHRLRPMRSQLYPALITNLMDPQGLVRTASLDLLIALASKESEKNVLSVCRTIIDTSVNYTNLREIGRVLQDLARQYHAGNETLNKAFPRMLFGMLTINSTPLWDIICELLAHMRDNTFYFETVMALLLKNNVEEDIYDPYEPLPAKDANIELADPHFTKLSSGIFLAHHKLKNYLSGTTDLMDSQLAASVRHCSFKTQALHALMKTPEMFVEHSATLMPLFFAAASVLDDGLSDYYSSTVSFSRDEALLSLQVLSNLENSNDIFERERYERLLLDIVAVGNYKAQSIALKCLTTFHNPAINNYLGHFERLLAEETLREELLEFFKPPSESSIEDAHRSTALSIGIRILYGRIAAKSRNEAFRKSIITSMVSLEGSALRIFIELCISPFRYCEIFDKMTTNFAANLDIEVIPPRTQENYLALMNDLMSILPHTLESYLHFLLPPYFYCLRSFTDTESTNTLIRRRLTTCIITALNKFPGYGWTPYASHIVWLLLSTDICSLKEVHNEHMLQIFSILESLTSDDRTLFFIFDYDVRIPSEIVNCLSDGGLAPEATLSVTRIIRNIALHGARENKYTSLFLHEYTARILSSINNILRNDKLIKIIRPQLPLLLEVLFSISKHQVEFRSAEVLVESLMELENQSDRYISSELKQKILETICVIVAEGGEDLRGRSSFWLQNLSRQLATITEPEVRQSFCCSLKNLCQGSNMEMVSHLIYDLNTVTFTQSTLEQPNVCLAAFSRLNESLYLNLRADEWTSVIYSLFYLLERNMEVSVRLNAAFAMKRFLEQASVTANCPAFRFILSNVILPQLGKRLRSQDDESRTEYLAILAKCVDLYTTEWPVAFNLKVLKCDEGNFFIDIGHIQKPRRVVALEILERACTRGEICQDGILILLPLLEGFVTRNLDERDLLKVAVRCIGKLVGALDWSGYSAILSKYVRRLSKSRDDLEATVDIICAISENLDSGHSKEDVNSTIVNEIYPQLKTFTKLTSELKLNYALAISKSLVRLLSATSDSTLANRLPGVLATVTTELRNKDPKVRELARNILSDIATFLGPNYLGFIIDQLGSVLRSGYQIHVLGYTVKTLLDNVVPRTPIGKLDYCAERILKLVAIDLFGSTGLEKDNDNYRSKAKEVHKQSSYSTLQLLSSVCTLKGLKFIFEALKSFLSVVSTSKDERKLESCFNSVKLGIGEIESLNKHDYLAFILEQLEEIDAHNHRATMNDTDVTDVDRYYGVDLEARREATRDHFNLNLPKFQGFKLDILASICEQLEWNVEESLLIRINSNVAKHLLSDDHTVNIAAFRHAVRLLSTQLEFWAADIGLYVSKAISIFRSSVSAESTAIEVSLDFLTAALKLLPEGTKKNMPESQVLDILIAIKPDLEAAEVSTHSLAFVEGVIAAQYLLPEVYDIADILASNMVTSYEQEIRDECSKIYFQFLMTYPHSAGRMSKQLEFITANLSYPQEKGRLSLLFLLERILAEFDESTLQNIFPQLFVALVMQLVNDPNTSCREMAGSLIKQALSKLNDENISFASNLLLGWLASKTASLQRASIQVFSLWRQASISLAPEIQKKCLMLAKEIVRVSSASVEADEDSAIPWELVYYCLNYISQLLNDKAQMSEAFRDVTLWRGIITLLLYRHTWIRMTTSKLIGLLFSQSNHASGDSILNAGSVELNIEDCVRLSESFILHLKSPFLTEQLGYQGIKNLIFLARAFGARDCPLPLMNNVIPGLFMDESVSCKDCLGWLAYRIADTLAIERTNGTTLLSKRFMLQWTLAMWNLLSETSLPTIIPFILPQVIRFQRTDDSSLHGNNH